MIMYGDIMDNNRKILDALREVIPDLKCELEYKTIFQCFTILF